MGFQPQTFSRRRGDRSAEGVGSERAQSATSDLRPNHRPAHPGAPGLAQCRMSRVSDARRSPASIASPQVAWLKRFAAIDLGIENGYVAAARGNTAKYGDKRWVSYRQMSQARPNLFCSSPRDSNDRDVRACASAFHNPSLSLSPRRICDRRTKTLAHASGSCPSPRRRATWPRSGRRARS